MKDDDRRGRFEVLGSQGHHKVPNVLDHSTDDNVVLGQLGILQGLKNDVVFGHRLGRYLTQGLPVSFDAVKLDVVILPVLNKLTLCNSIPDFVDHLPVIVL